jgi:hypothetical protein
MKMGDFVLQYWIQTLFGIIISALTIVIKKIFTKLKLDEEERKCIKDGLLAIIHDRLYQACQHYIKQNFVTVDELKNLEFLYKSYSALGGNGTGAELYNRCCKLEILD